MPILHSNDFKTAALGLAALFAALLPHVASATLGQPEISVQADVDKAHAAIKTSEDRTAYRVHEIQLPSGTVMREFVAPNGTVFAVAWQGPTRPDLRQLLGQYFDAFTSPQPRSGQPPPPPPTNNTASVIVDEGPSNQSVNTMFTSVTVCVPGSTSSCQTIDHIQVDTGSYGLRILAPVLTLTLPVETLASGSSLAECTQFVDGFSWGPVVTADFQIAGETAKSLPVQVIGDPRFTNIPSECSGTGLSEEDTVAEFGANGILGVGPFELDCGDCDMNTPGLYFACPTTGTTCTDTTVPANMQEPNPVTHFAADNNGVIVVLPAVAAGGASNVMGSLIFGIDTQTDNASGTQTVLTVDDDAELAIIFNGQTLAQSFIDSGSNGIYFADSSITMCTAPPNDPTSQIVNFYCPSSTLTLPIIIQGMNGTMTDNLTFDVGNAETMLQNDFDAFPQLAGTLPPGNAGSFDYGLPFFYGRRVAVAVQGATTKVGTGPYIAF